MVMMAALIVIIDELMPEIGGEECARLMCQHESALQVQDLDYNQALLALDLLREYTSVSAGTSSVIVTYCSHPQTIHNHPLHTEFRT